MNYMVYIDESSMTMWQSEWISEQMSKVEGIFDGNIDYWSPGWAEGKV